MEKLIGELLRGNHLTISCAESCTGGLLTSKLTDVSGSSDYVKGSIVAYSNEIKISALHVKKETLKKFGAVSHETAVEMSKNILKIFQTNIGVGVTGIAGPGGGSAEKPVGLVYVAVSDAYRTFVEKFIFSGSRTEIKNQAAEAALSLIIKFFS